MVIEAILSLRPDGDHREMLKLCITSVLNYYEKDIEASQPLGSAPLGSAPLGSAPLGSAPLGSAPLGSAPLGSTMDYSDVERMTFQLSIQLEILETHGFSVIFLQPSDILVISFKEFTLYWLSNLSQMVPLYAKDQTQMVIVYPTIFPLPKERCAPELLQMNILPFITPCNASYYSLALLSLQMLNLSLAALEGTKLFYFLERVLKREPSERWCLYLF
jgi:hypothetical protein